MIHTRYLAAALLAALIGAMPAHAAGPANPPPSLIADIPAAPPNRT